MRLIVVYADLVFAVNFVIDGTVLFTTAWVRGLRPRWPRLAGAAAIGACYVVFMLAPALSFLYTFLVKIALSLLMLWAAFGFGSLQHFTRNIAAFYGVNFAAAGGVLGIYYLLQSSGELWDGIWFARTGKLGIEFNAGIWFVLAAAAAALYVYRAVWNGRRKLERTESHLAGVTVTIDGREWRCTGLIDTGNQLYDPLTRTPVMVMEAAVWQSELPAAWMERIRDTHVDRLLAGLDADNSPWRDRLRLVPYRGINRGTQFMLALKPDGVCIEQNGRMYESHKVLIGLDGGKLVSDGTYQAIVHPSLLESRDAG
ncbi:MAG TPA: sigma-E processing peptidase SpoIIGA [Paenibacillus sp.]|uniref:sigma-E processing peptidase SpoIIGA n=1 Tax=Paenibacillus sp. TaxID=58172 RepID=UPI0028D60331|nr:sigma-E processing peptidase SpoIIGA [Paenibacillus sp.]HUC93127.1 sigma-E processing peptidase SpoIIGA [Paenibacillus sp.]